MTDQPKWEVIHNSISATYLEQIGDDRVIGEARFIGTDREANAKLFLRVQMLDELVGAAEEARRFIEIEYECRESQAEAGEYVSVVARSVFNKLCDILAKIEGAK